MDRGISIAMDYSFLPIGSYDMATKHQKEILTGLMDSAREHLLANSDDWPEDWTGVELRMQIGFSKDGGAWTWSTARSYDGNYDAGSWVQLFRVYPG